jgi:hypothetical protein
MNSTFYEFINIKDNKYKTLVDTVCHCFKLKK